MLGHFKNNFAGISTRDQRNFQVFSRWSAAWALSFLVAIIVLGPESNGSFASSWWMWLLAILPIVPGIGAVRAFVNFLMQAEDLLKQVQLEALAKGFGAGIILGTAFALGGQILGQWEDAGVFIWSAMIVTYTISLKRAWRRYDV